MDLASKFMMRRAATAGRSLIATQIRANQTADTNAKNINHASMLEVQSAGKWENSRIPSIKMAEVVENSSYLKPLSSICEKSYAGGGSKLSKPPLGTRDQEFRIPAICGKK